jgi:hypothetical protein
MISSQLRRTASHRASERHRFLRFFRVLCIVCVALLPLSRVADAQVTNTQVTYAQVTEPVYVDPDPSNPDPFCMVAVTATSAQPLILQLHAAGSSVTARIVVFTANAAYTAATPALALSGDKPMKTTAAFAIVPAKPVPMSRKQATKTKQGSPTAQGSTQPEPSLPALSDPIIPRYMYVDAYSIDGGPEVTCLTEPVAFLEAPSQTPRENAAAQAQATQAQDTQAPTPTPRGQLDATTQVPVSSVQPLPPLSCGVERTKATVKMAVAPDGFDREFDNTSATILSYVDARGTLARTVMYQSSGSNLDDRLSLYAASKSVYVPATFYCMAVPGLFLYRTVFQRMR